MAIERVLLTVKEGIEKEKKQGGKRGISHALHGDQKGSSCYQGE